MVAYNAEIYLNRALSHLLSQNFQDYELVFVDNGSTDSTAEIINRFHEEHPEIDMQLGKIIVNDGLPKGRNLGLSMAKGCYVMFHDVDDWMDADCLETIARAARLNCSERIIQQVRYVNDMGEEFEELCYPKDASRWLKNTLQGDLFLRDIITKNDLCFVKEAFYDDFFFVNLFNSVSKNAFFINETHYNMCMHDHSLTHKVDAIPGYYPSRLASTFDSMRGIMEKLIEPNEKILYEYNCLQIYYYHVFHCYRMPFHQKISEYKLLNQIMKKYYPLYLNNQNVKFYAPNGYEGHFKRNIWICTKAEKVDRLLHVSVIMILILMLYHFAILTRLYKYKA